MNVNAKNDTKWKCNCLWKHFQNAICSYIRRWLREELICVSLGKINTKEIFFSDFWTETCKKQKIAVSEILH